MAGPPRDRLAALLDPMRRARGRMPDGTYDTPGQAPGFFPYSLSCFTRPKDDTFDLRTPLTQAFLAASASWLPLEEFLDSHARAALVRRLRAAGVFLADATEGGGGAKRAARRGRGDGSSGSYM